MADRPLKLLLIDSDAIVRLGLQTALQSHTAIGAIAVQSALNLDRLGALGRLDTPQAVADETPIEQPDIERPDVVLLNLLSLSQDEGLERLERAVFELRQRLPGVPLLGLEYSRPPALARWAERIALEGYWTRSRSVDELVEAIQQLQRGQRVWTLSTVSQSTVSQPTVSRGSPQEGEARGAATVQYQRRSLNPWSRTLASGMAQIETNIQALEQQRQDPQTFVLDQLWLAGWQRELRASRWLLQRLGGQPLGGKTEPQGWELENGSSVPLRLQKDRQDLKTPERVHPGTRTPGSVTPGSGMSQFPRENLSPRLNPGGRELQTLLFDQISLRMPPGLVNYTEEPQEIDILNASRRQELLSTVLRCWGELLVDVRLSNLPPEGFGRFMGEKRSELLLDLWQASLSDFLGRYSTLTLEGNMVELLPVLLQEQVAVERSILRPIPGVEMLVGALLFSQPVTIDGTPYRPTSPEALERLGLLMENLLITVANAVVQPLLNHFAEVDAIREGFYDRRLLSTREIEKFRNNLSWKYRVAHLFREAQDIYESRYGLLGFSDRGIEKCTIYAPRRQDLTTLTPLQQSVTLMLEVRDAVAPQLKFLAGWVGSGMVYVLTQIVGRGIGLIGRGIIQGVGSSIQDVRTMGKNR